MPLSEFIKNVGLDAMAAELLFQSLHSAYSAVGGNELAGGSPAYARRGKSWNPAAGGALDDSDQETFDVPAGATVAYVGHWDAITTGNFCGMSPAGAGPRVGFVARNTGDIFEAPGHGLANNHRVAFFAGAGTLPTGITEGTIYHVISVSGNTFQVSETQGGAAVTLTTDGSGYLQACVPEVFAGQGTYQVSDTDIDLNG